MAGIGVIAVSSRGWLGEAGDGACRQPLFGVGMALSPFVVADKRVLTGGRVWVQPETRACRGTASRLSGIRNEGRQAPAWPLCLFASRMATRAEQTKRSRLRSCSLRFASSGASRTASLVVLEKTNTDRAFSW
jgi:hypothetical protein